MFKVQRFPSSQKGQSQFLLAVQNKVALLHCRFTWKPKQFLGDVMYANHALVNILMDCFLSCVKKVFKCLFGTLLMHKMWIWKTHEMNLFHFFLRLSTRKKASKTKKFSQKMPEEVIKISRNEKNSKELFYYSSFLGLCKFRKVKWK